MKRFYLFAGYNYYPAGGWDDFNDSFDSVDEAIKIGKEHPGDWYHVIDSQTGESIR
jgi:hypothetical protein